MSTPTGGSARDRPAHGAESSPEAVVQATGLGKRFRSKGDSPIEALRGLDLRAARGQVTGLVGPDGAGKTTLLRLAAGLLVPSAGSLRVLGLNPASESSDELAAVRSQIGYMPQQFGLYEDLSVQENLSLYANLQGVPRTERAERFERLLEMTDLARFTERRAGRLSGGMKQKLGLACCLVRWPPLLLLDEPTVGVDPVSRRDLWRIVYALVERESMSVLLSTAYLDEAERCHRVVLMHEGVKLDEGTPEHFHARVRGRVALLRPAAGRRPRDVQAAIAARDDVVDASIRSGLIRTVLKARSDGTAASALLGNAQEAGDPSHAGGLDHWIDPAATVAAEPVFEDAFVDALADAASGLDQGTAVQSTTSATPTTVLEDAGDDDIVVRAEGLTKRFGDFTAVRDMSFEVARGEVFGLLGANGAGKSTSFRMLCGLLPASGGVISVAGHDLRRSRAQARASLGYMAQRFSLYRELPVIQNLRFYGRAYGLGGTRLRERVDWALDEFDLGPRRDLPAGQLPGGYRQRLAMAVAMLHEPQILFLDEPTSGADPLARREFWLRINGFARMGVTVVVTTHFMEEAEFCDHMVIMASGSVLAAGTPAEIRALAQAPGNPSPTMEDAFVALAEGHASPNPTPASDAVQPGAIGHG